MLHCFSTDGQTGRYPVISYTVHFSEMGWGLLFVPIPPMQRVLPSLAVLLLCGIATVSLVKESWELLRASSTTTPPCLSSAIFQATKIHQRAFGNDHPITARSLELMATVYAEIGKTEYSGKHSSGITDRVNTGQWKTRLSMHDIPERRVLTSSDFISALF